MDFAILVSSSLIQNPNAPPSVILNEATTSIGRHAKAKMDTTKTHEISKHHALIRYQQIHNKHVWTLEDNKSMNGTFLNFKKIKKHILKHGDEVVFGGGSCFFYGDQITSTDSAECRYIFVVPDENVEFSPSSNRDIVLSQVDDCEDCCICYMPMTMQTKLSCGHSFCRHCLSKWGKQCKRKEQPFVCPICRHEYDPSQAKVPSIYYENDTFYIQDVESFLRTLDVLSIQEIEKLSIFREWNSEDREKFWLYFNTISHSMKKTRIFRTVTGASYRAVKDAEIEQLQNAVINLEGNKNCSYLKEEVMMKVAYLIYKLEYVKPNDKKPL